MTNSDAAAGVQNEALYAIATEYGWPEYGPREIQPIALESATGNALVGVYPVPVSLTGGQEASQFIRRAGDAYAVEVAGFVPKTVLVALADGVLLAPETGFEFRMVRDASGCVIALDIGSARLTKKP